MSRNFRSQAGIVRRSRIEGFDNTHRRIGHHGRRRVARWLSFKVRHQSNYSACETFRPDLRIRAGSARTSLV